MALFIMMVGAAGSGKSTYAKRLVNMWHDKLEENEIVYLSSDELRAEIYGDESIQGNADVIFKEMHKRTIDALSRGVSVIYDATNLKRGHRVNLLNKIKRCGCNTICIVMNTSLEDCLKRNQERERHVPNDVIERQYGSLEYPQYNEGWTEIHNSDSFLN